MARSSCDLEAVGGEQKQNERRRRARIVCCIAVAVAVIDLYLYLWLIPWVDSQEWARTDYGSVGYALFFIMVSFTFVTFVASVAFFFSGSSYPADKWQ
ncbi:MAG: hypothetical protein JSV90_03690 [Methanobacteriota archaeon]|nr:MAG: hypothetical protein JSV90_03690 [Euryarchaeota archaeon]